MMKRYRKNKMTAFIALMISAVAVSFFRMPFIWKCLIWLILGESVFFIEQASENGIRHTFESGVETKKRRIFLVFLILLGLALLAMCLVTDGGYPIFRNVIILGILAGLEGCLTAFFLWFSRSGSISRTAGILMTVFGAIFMIILPFGTVPDEAMHLYTAYHMSDHILRTDAKDPQHTVMRAGDMKYRLTETEYDDEKMEAYYAEFDRRNMDLRLKDEKVPLVSGYDYLYVVPAVGISLGRIIRLNSFQTFLLGRICNLILSVLCICAAVNIIPFGKMILLVMSLMPMTLQQAMSYSYDAPINAVFFLFIALIMEWFYGRRKHPKGHFGLMVILAVLTAMVKSHAYVMLALLPLFMGIERKMKGLKRKTRVLIGGGTVLLILAILAGAFVAARKLPSVTLRPKDHYSLVFLLQNPVEIINITYQTIIHNGSVYLDSMAGMYLGYLNLKISPLIIYLIYFLLLVSAVKGENEKLYVRRPDRILFLAAAFFITAFSFGGMLLANSKYGDHMVMGMQGRYLLPAVMLILLCFRNPHLQKDPAIDCYTVCGEMVSLLLVTCNLIAII